MKVSFGGGFQAQVQYGDIDSGMDLIGLTTPDGNADFIIRLNKEVDADRMITTVFYWIEISLQGKPTKIMRTIVSVDPAFFNAAIGISARAPAPLEKVDRVQIELLKIVDSHTFRLQ